MVLIPIIRSCRGRRLSRLRRATGEGWFLILELGLEGVAVEEVDGGSADVEESEYLGRLETGEQVVEHGAVVVHGAFGGDCPAVGTGEIALDEDAAGSAMQTLRRSLLRA
jgi:hypothetical protein